MSDSIKRSDMILFLAQRREHIRKHRKEYKTKREYDIADSVYCDILLALQSEGGIPSAEPQTGHWIKVKPRGCFMYSDIHTECDKCHKIVQYGWNYEFCPKCGVRMEGDKNENSIH